MLQPTGAYATNLLGLSDQVPAKVVFLTDGRSKRLRLGKLDIVLKQTSPRMMATAGSASGTVIQALRHLGNAHVADDTVGHLNRRLSADDRKILLKDVADAPVWIGRFLGNQGFSAVDCCPDKSKNERMASGKFREIKDSLRQLYLGSPLIESFFNEKQCETPMFHRPLFDNWHYFNGLLGGPPMR